MTEIEVAAWQLNNEFAPHVVAALIMGINPHEATKGQTYPIFQRMHNDYNSAIFVHMQNINDDYLGAIGPNDLKRLLETSLQSKAMISNVETSQFNPNYNHHDLYSWLLGNSEDPGAWNRSNFNEQTFTRDEIVKWLKVNEITSVFPFYRAEPLRFLLATNHQTTSLNAGSQVVHSSVISTHDPLPLDGIALMFKLKQVEADNSKHWRKYAKGAERNGLAVARVVIGKGTAQSKFDPVAVGEWLVSKGLIDQAKVDRFLMSNLPKRSAHLKDFGP